MRGDRPEGPSRPAGPAGAFRTGPTRSERFLDFGAPKISEIPGRPRGERGTVAIASQHFLDFGASKTSDIPERPGREMNWIDRFGTILGFRSVQDVRNSGAAPADGVPNRANRF